MNTFSAAVAALAIVSSGATAHATSEEAYPLDYVTFREAPAPSRTVIEDAQPASRFATRDLTPINVSPADLPQVSRYTELLKDSRYFAAIPSLPSYYEQNRPY